MIMQSQKNIISSQWYEDTTNDSKGLITALDNLERVTGNWNNVNDQTYIMRTTIFKDNAYTCCNGINSCTKNIYTLLERTAKARMITVQEANALGCSEKCPV